MRCGDSGCPSAKQGRGSPGESRNKHEHGGFNGHSFHGGCTPLLAAGPRSWGRVRQTELDGEQTSALELDRKSDVRGDFANSAVLVKMSVLATRRGTPLRRSRIGPQREIGVSTNFFVFSSLTNWSGGCEMTAEPVANQIRSSRKFAGPHWYYYDFILSVTGVPPEAEFGQGLPDDRLTRGFFFGSVCCRSMCPRLCVLLRR